jgi:hypothetical protein
MPALNLYVVCVFLEDGGGHVETTAIKLQINEGRLNTTT